MAVLPNEAAVKNLLPDMAILRNIAHRGIVVTAPGENVDFVSRTFYPQKTLTKEDAVTGASHCLLVPYWAKRLNKNTLTARQLSARGGLLKCKLNNDRVLLSGQGVLYSSGKIRIQSLETIQSV